MKILMTLILLLICFLILILVNMSMPVSSTIWIADLLSFIPVVIYMSVALGIFIFGYWFRGFIEKNIHKEYLKNSK